MTERVASLSHVMIASIADTNQTRVCVLFSNTARHSVALLLAFR